MTEAAPAITTNQMTELLLDGAVRRFVQDSPILPDVWCRFAEAGPADTVDLLLTHHERGRSAAVAAAFRTDLDAHREAVRARVPGKTILPASVAPLPGFVAATVDMEELFVVVLPRTTWWSNLARAHPRLLEDSRSGSTLLADAVEAFRGLDAAHNEKQQKAVKSSGFPQAWLWLISNAGALLAAKRPHREGAPADGAWPPSGAESVRAALDLFSGAFPTRMPDLPDEQTIWNVSLNREAKPATAKSVLAVKADAARLLFSISCKDIVWAVLDTGIDSEHPAFVDHSKRPDPKTGKPPSRVIRTYDFTRIRDLLDPAYLNRSLAEDTADKELVGRLQRYLESKGEEHDFPAVARYVRALKERIEKGFDVDWGMLEPFLLLTKPRRPTMYHGTHVAGILGADWRVVEKDEKDGEAEASEKAAKAGSDRKIGKDEKSEKAEKPEKVRLKGMCPDIQLVDMRVIADGAGAEFGVIAALQFIRYLNSRGDSQAIHGVNLSFYTPHNVQSYACGSTPVCTACDSLVAKGVVVVAAAGNEGHRTLTLAEGKNVAGYLAISITDPGNAERVITVGSAHRERPHQYGVSYFSSRGPTGDGRIKPDLVAPGEKINSALPDEGEGPRDGTSQAAPHVSGAAALLMARYPEFIGKPDQIKKILCDTATDIGRDRYFQGAGMLDVLRALQSI